MGWLDCRVGDVADSKKNALVGGPFGSNLVSLDYTSTGVPVIRGQNMGRGRWVDGDFAFVSEAKAASLAANIARPGDLVFTQRGTLGQVALVPAGRFEEYLLSQSQMKLSVDERKADALFLYYVFMSPEQQNHISRNAIQTGVPHTNLGILRTTPLRLPPLPEQRLIAEILGSLDDKIELNRRMSETLEALSRTLFTEWSATLEAKYVPAHQMIEEGVLAIGDGYRAKNSELSETGLPFARAADISGTVNVSDQTEHLSPQSVAAAGEKISRAGDVVITTKGTVGRVARVAESTRTFVYSPQLCYWRSLDEAIDPYVLFLWICSSHFREQLQRVSGQTDMAPYVSLRDQRDFLVPRFAPSEQHAISAKLRPLIDRQAHNNLESQTLAQLRDTLLPKLLSGKLRVCDAEKQAADVV